MKKVFSVILLVAFLGTSCSSSDDPSTNSQINPPNWIQGTWISELDGISTGMGFKFSSDDFCSLNNSQTSCEGHVTIDEEIDTENYIITLNNNEMMINTFHFKKLTETKIEAVHSSGSNTTFFKQ
jgi:hypothetical protein